MKTISDHFDKALQGWGGTPIATCQCGRVHCATESRDITPEEREVFEKNRRQLPDRYIAGEGDGIGIVTFNGVGHVWNCPCESLARAEEWIWAHRETITRYLRARLDAEAKTAAAQAERLKL